MAKTAMTLTVKRAWWVLPYLCGVQLFCEATGMEPDYEKVAATCLRGISVRVD